MHISGSYAVGSVILVTRLFGFLCSSGFRVFVGFVLARYGPDPVHVFIALSVDENASRDFDQLKLAVLCSLDMDEMFSKSTIRRHQRRMFIWVLLLPSLPNRRVLPLAVGSRWPCTPP